MKNIPNIIYLNLGDDDELIELIDNFTDLEEVTWCADKIYKGDIKYIRADLLPPGAGVVHIGTPKHDTAMNAGRALGLRQAANLLQRYIDDEYDNFLQADDPGITIFGLTEAKLTELKEEIIKLIRI